MSTKTELDLADPWVRLQFVYENCRTKQYVDGHYAKYDNDGKLSMCGIGWALHCSGYRDDELKSSLACIVKNFANPRSPMKALREFGFSLADRRKIRYCPLPDCTYFATLQGVLEHLNEAAHKTPIPNIGKLIPIIRNSTKKYTIADHIKVFVKDVRAII